jgi:predicted GTPase
VLDVGHPHAEQQFKSVHQVLEEIGAKGKPEILLLNKIDTEEGEQAYPFWRTLHQDAIPISAKTGLGLDKLQEAVYRFVRGQQVDVTLEAELTNGKLLAFLESHTRIHDRAFVEANGDGSGDGVDGDGRGRVRIRAIMGKQTLADLSRNEQVAILSTAAAEVEPRGSATATKGAWRTENGDGTSSHGDD